VGAARSLLNTSEHAAGASRMFEAMDANKDGKVTAAEMDAAHERVTGQKAMKGEMTAADKIKVVDADGDGILTAAEHAAGSRKMFEAMDTNKDGFVGKEELAAGHARPSANRIDVNMAPSAASPQPRPACDR
jgi:Ca2+-binding EF-hand superfamily protein